MTAAITTETPMSVVLDVLKYFKATEKEKETPERVHPLIKDAELRNFVVLWPMIPVKFEKPTGPLPDSENERWVWLWKNVTYDKKECSEHLRIDRMKLTRIMERAVAFRLVYPDGTSNGYALQYIRGEIARSLKKGPGGANNP